VEFVGTVLTTVGVSVLIVALVWAHLTPTGLNPLRDPVSRYGITSTRRLYATAAFAAAVAAIGAIIVLTSALDTPALVTSVFLAIFAAARALIPFVPMDAPDAAPTATGRIHNVLAFAAFASITIAAFLAGGILHDGGFSTAATWSTVTAVVMALGSVGVLASRFIPALHRTFGLWERLIYLGFIGWFCVIVAVGLN
jgi:hypothetical protein